MVSARWFALVVVAALVIGAAGCGSSEKGTDVRKVAFVAPFGDNEPDWTLKSERVVEEWSRRLHIRVDVVDASQTSDLRGAFRQAADDGAQLVIAHDGRYAEAAEAVAGETRVPTLVWGDRPHAPKGLVGQIHVQDKEGGYIAGVVAAHAAVTRRLGILVLADGSAWDTATWNRMAGGFVAGARSVDPAERFFYAQVGEDGEATTKQVYDASIRLQQRGAQMIFTLGGAATLGSLRAVDKISGENLYVGVIGDKARFNRENDVLETLMYDTRGVLRQALRDVRTGRFAQRPYELTLRDRGLWLLNTGRTPMDAYEAGLDAARRIERGRLQMPVTPTREAVEDLIAGSGGQG